jgi:hypothetical protein
VIPGALRARHVLVQGVNRGIDPWTFLLPGSPLDRPAKLLAGMVEGTPPGSYKQ